MVEVPSPHSGRIARLVGKVHDRVKVGAVIVEFEEGAHPDTGTVVEDLSPAAAAAPTRAPEPKAPSLATPAVRALARERGVDLRKIVGHGPGGAISRDDVERTAAPPDRAVAGEKLRGMRRSMAETMARAHAAVVPATLFDEADVEAWWKPGADVTVRLIRGIVAGCRAAPGLNAWFDGRAMARDLKRQIDLGIAVDTEDGLIVPVLRDAGSADADTLRHQLSALVTAARSRTLALAQLRDATITLSNFGMLAGRHAALVVVPPQIAIIGAGRIAPQPVPAQQGSVFHQKLPLSLTFDHRAATGGDAARFLQAIIADLENGGLGSARWKTCFALPTSGGRSRSSTSTVRRSG